MDRVIEAESSGFPAEPAPSPSRDRFLNASCRPPANSSVEYHCESHWLELSGTTDWMERGRTVDW